MNHMKTSVEILKSKHKRNQIKLDPSLIKCVLAIERKCKKSKHEPVNGSNGLILRFCATQA